MSEPPGVEDPDEIEPPVAPMPRFIPVLLGVVLVALAALAVYTGVKRRAPLLDPSLAQSRTVQQDDGGAPGEPQPGASRVLHGESGENIPVAEPMAEPDPSRVAITGGPGGVSDVVRLRARRGLQVLAEPATAVVYVNESPIGEARQFARADSVYEFAEEGTFNVRIASNGYDDVLFEVTADQTADAEIAVLNATLRKSR
jgi:hypothetical protein